MYPSSSTASGLPSELLATAPPAASAGQPPSARPDDQHYPAFASRYMTTPILKNRFPAEGMPPRVVQQLIKDMRQLDATPRLNLASFVTTWMEDECNQLLSEAMNVNFIDAEEYPSSQEIHQRCISMLAHLLHTDPSSPPMGTSTVGSSEGILLAGLALKRRWQARQTLSTTHPGPAPVKPNLVLGREAHVVWEKLLNYFEIEAHWVDNEPGSYTCSPEQLVAACDENTIGVVAILGTTYTGAFYDIEELDRQLRLLNERNGWEIGIHVDAASGGFVAPFAYPQLLWDFRLPSVVSINVSGHKYGLVYPGIGFVLWRSKAYLPDSLVFRDNYLGADQISITLNFSKSAMQVVGQYYQFLRLGFEGYRQIMSNCLAAADYLRARIESLHRFDILSAPGTLPLVAFSLKLNNGAEQSNGALAPPQQASAPAPAGQGMAVSMGGESAGLGHADGGTGLPYTEFEIADRLRQRGWVVPAYTLAAKNEARRTLRVVVREDFTVESADMLLEDLVRALSWCDAHFRLFTPQQLGQLKEKELGPARKGLAAPTDLGVC